MEALILSCGTGGGHNSAAMAVADAWRRRGHEAVLLDPYQLVSEKVAMNVGDLYVKLVQHSPRLFGCVYSLGEAYRRMPIHSPVYWANGKAAFNMQEYLETHRFDWIVMTHMYPAHILDHLRDKMALPKTVLVSTDYTCIPFMEESNCDYYVIPSSDLYEEYCARGIPGNKILPYGIPVRREFSQGRSKSDARAELGLSDEKKYILLSGGSIGVGELDKTALVLEQFLEENKDCRLLIVCGNNERLYAGLQKKYAGHPQIRVMASTPKMAAYMEACDLFISKPGGLSSTEAAVCGAPLIHVSPIPGCEQRNAEFFCARGMSRFVNDPSEDLLPALHSLQQGNSLEEMRSAQWRCINPHAADDLCAFMERSSSLS